MSCWASGLNWCDAFEFLCYQWMNWDNGGGGVMLVFLFVRLLSVGCVRSVQSKFFFHMLEVLVQGWFKWLVILSTIECILLMMMLVVVVMVALLFGRSLFAVLEVLNVCFSIDTSMMF